MAGGAHRGVGRRPRPSSLVVGGLPVGPLPVRPPVLLLTAWHCFAMIARVVLYRYKDAGEKGSVRLAYFVLAGGGRCTYSGVPAAGLCCEAGARPWSGGSWRAGRRSRAAGQARTPRSWSRCRRRARSPHDRLPRPALRAGARRVRLRVRLESLRVSGPHFVPGDDRGPPPVLVDPVDLDGHPHGPPSRAALGHALSDLGQNIAWTRSVKQRPGGTPLPRVTGDLVQSSVT